MTVPEVLSLLATLLVISFLLSGLESAILSVSMVRVRHAAKENPAVEKLERILSDRQRLLIAVLLISTTANLAAFALLTSLMVDWLGSWGYLLSFVVSLPVYLIWIELTPKSLFKRFSLRTLRLFSPFLRAVQLTVCPMLALLSWIPDQIFRLFKLEPAPKPRGATAEEFRALTEIFEREGTLDQGERVMIQSVLDFHRIEVRDVMVPLSKTTAVPQEMPVDVVMSLARQTHYDQFPVMSPNGDLIGIVSILDLLRNPVSDGTVEQHRRKLVHAAPEDKAINVVKRLRHAGHQLAAVYNANNRPIGVVSVQDLVQKLVKPVVA
ncbi:MAG: DUF21 domain-containing protein [Verrucomicrobiales bacterium]|nr:DUF21 domain-containing protein [Verrucomicrobiales bacterium]